MTHTKIEEVGAANFFGITKDNQFITPYSPSILPSITKYSLLWLAEHRLGMTVKEGRCICRPIRYLRRSRSLWYSRSISPVGGIQNGDDFHVFYSETEVGPVTRRLYDELVGHPIWRRRGSRGGFKKFYKNKFFKKSAGNLN